MTGKNRQFVLVILELGAPSKVSRRWAEREKGPWNGAPREALLHRRRPLADGERGVGRRDDAGRDRHRRTIGEGSIQRESDAVWHSSAGASGSCTLLSGRDRRQVRRERQEGAARVRGVAAAAGFRHCDRRDLEK